MKKMFRFWCRYLVLGVYLALAPMLACADSDTARVSLWEVRCQSDSVSVWLGSRLQSQLLSPAAQW